MRVELGPHSPSARFTANAAWLTLAVIAHSLGRAVGALAGMVQATTAPLRRRLFTTRVGWCIPHAACTYAAHGPTGPDPTRSSPP
jgi:hypothetical protein